MACTDAISNVGVGHASIWSCCQAVNLPEQHSVRPPVGFDGAHVKIERFGCHPPYWDGSGSTNSPPVVIFLGTNCSAESKISKLAQHLLGQEHVSGGEIAVERGSRDCERTKSLLFFLSQLTESVPQWSRSSRVEMRKDGNGGAVEECRSGGAVPGVNTAVRAAGWLRCTRPFA